MTGRATARSSSFNGGSGLRTTEAQTTGHLARGSTKRGWGEICSVEIKSRPGGRLAWLGGQLELLPLSFGWLLARRILARLDEVSPRLQRLAASLDHPAVPIRQLSLIADTVRQAELEHFAAEIVLLVVSAPIPEARAAAMHGGFDGSALDGPNKRVRPERLMLLGVVGGEHVLIR